MLVALSAPRVYWKDQLLRSENAIRMKGKQGEHFGSSNWGAQEIMSI